jgi:hypothetical protein
VHHKKLDALRLSGVVGKCETGFNNEYANGFIILLETKKPAYERWL